MSVWYIMPPRRVLELTQEYIRKNMPEGTTEVVIPEGVECIDTSIFLGCTNLESVVISASVKTIRSWAFEACTGLRSILVPEGVKSIGEGAFLGCMSLNLIVLPDSLVDKRVEYGITSAQMVIPYGQFMYDWKCKNGLEDKPYSDRVFLFLYQLQNIEYFNPSWDDILRQYPKAGVEDMLYFSGGKELNQKLRTVILIYGQQVPIGIESLRYEIIYHLTLADFSCSYLTSQSLFSRPFARAQSLKVLSLTMCAVLTIGVGIAYMQREEKVVDPGFFDL